MRLGISIRINVSKIRKDRLYNGEKGTYLDLTTFVDIDNKGDHDQNGFIAQSVTRDEREQGMENPILGPVKIFWSDSNQQRQNPQQIVKPKQQQAPISAAQDFQNAPDSFPDDDIPDF